MREDYTQSVHSGEQNRIDYERSIRDIGMRLAHQTQLVRVQPTTDKTTETGSFH